MVLYQSHVAQHVLDFLAIVVSQAAQHPVRDAPVGQSFLEGPRLSIRTIQNGKITVFAVYRFYTIYFRGHEICFVPFIFCPEIGDFIPCFMLRPQFFWFPPPVVGDDRMSSIQNV